MNELDTLAIAAEAVAGGVVQVLHHYVENACIALLPEARPAADLHMALTPFLGPRAAAKAARASKQPAPAPA